MNVSNAPVSNVKTLALVKITGKDLFQLIEYFDDMDEVLLYLKQIQQNIDYAYQHQMEGEYLVIPVIYFNLRRKT